MNKNKTKDIVIKLEIRRANDFFGHAGSRHKAKGLIEKWIQDYVEEKNKEDLEIIEKNKESLTSGTLGTTI